MMVHLNINSCQNKLDDLILLNKELKSHVIFLSETKIDSSYTNAQVALEGYHTYRVDRKKGKGWWWPDGIFLIKDGIIV